MSQPIQDRPMVPPTDANPPAPSRRRWFTVVAVASLGGLLLGGAYLILRPGDPVGETVASAPAPAASDGAGADPAPPAAEADSAAQPAGDAGDPAPSPSPSARVVRTTVKMTSRDPFAPLVSTASPKPAKAKADKPAAAAPSAATGATISALKISALGNSATLKLNGKKYDVEEGETFATSYRLYDIFNADCAGFLYGDQNVVACEGDSVQVG